MSSFKYVQRLALFLLVMIGVERAQADVVISNTGVTCTLLTPRPNIALGNQNINIGAQIRNGSLVYQKTVTLELRYTCPKGQGATPPTWRLEFSPTLGLPASGVSTTPVASGFPGLGFIVIGRAPPSTSRVNCVSSDCSLVLNVQFDVGLVKTAPTLQGKITRLGSVTVSPVISASLVGGNAFNRLDEKTPIVVSVTGELEVTRPTCTIKSERNIINMGTHLIGNFNGVGSGSTWMPFNLILDDCAVQSSYITSSTDPALISVTDIMNVQFDGEKASNGSFFAVSGGQNGLGLELGLPTGRSIPPGESWLINNSRNFSSPAYTMRARYVQIGQEVIAGKASTTITATITYR